jgi:hypothetical protein
MFVNTALAKDSFEKDSFEYEFMLAVKISVALWTSRANLPRGPITSSEDSIAHAERKPFLL